MPGVEIRPVQLDDLETLYEHQADPIAAEMAAFPSRDRDVFFQHWQTRVLANPTGWSRAVVADGAVAGNIVSWIDSESGHRLFGYWLGSDFWGRGIATEAVRLYLVEMSERPLYADVAVHNIGSQGVLEKNGFVRTQPEPTTAEDGIELLLFVLN